MFCFGFSGSKEEAENNLKRKHHQKSLDCNVERKFMEIFT